MVEEARRRIGHRGQALLILGLFEAFVGLGSILEPPHRPAGVFVIHELIPPTWYGFAWIVGGLTALGFIFTDSARGRDKLGFGLLFIMPVITALSFYLSWGLHLTEHVFHQPGYDRGWVAGSVYMLTVGLLWNTAGWPEPARTLPAFVTARGRHGRRRATD